MHPTFRIDHSSPLFPTSIGTESFLENVVAFNPKLISHGHTEPAEGKVPASPKCLVTKIEVNAQIELFGRFHIPLLPITDSGLPITDSGIADQSLLGSFTFLSEFLTGPSSLLSACGQLDSLPAVLE